MCGYSRDVIKEELDYHLNIIYSVNLNIIVLKAAKMQTVFKI